MPGCSSPTRATRAFESEYGSRATASARQHRKELTARSARPPSRRGRSTSSRTDRTAAPVPERACVRPPACRSPRRPRSAPGVPTSRRGGRDRRARGTTTRPKSTRASVKRITGARVTSSPRRSSSSHSALPACPLLGAFLTDQVQFFERELDSMPHHLQRTFATVPGEERPKRLVPLRRQAPGVAERRRLQRPFQRGGALRQMAHLHRGSRMV